MIQEYNPNPHGKRVGDCVVRAICKALDKSWYEVFIELCIQGLLLGDMPSSNAVWGAYLKGKGFKKDIVSDECPECYTLEDFAREHPVGTYVIGTGSHAVCISHGEIYDSWQSADEVPIYFYYKGD